MNDEDEDGTGEAEAPGSGEARSVGGTDEVVASARGSAVALVQHVVVSAMAGLVVVVCVVEREWLGARSVWLALFAGLGGLTMWGAGWWNRRVGVSWTTGLSLLGAVVTGPALSRMRGSISERLFGRDLPPRAVYAMALAFVAMMIVALSLVVRGRGPVRGPIRTLGRGLVAGALVSAVLVGALLVGGGVARSAADHSAESDALTHTVSHRARRTQEAPGPAEPTREAWQADRTDDPFRAPAVVPGWDVVIVGGRSKASVVALSKAEGTELWRYERNGGPHLYSSITVDPERGRVLLFASETVVVVLALEDGEELAVVELPDLACYVPVADRFGADPHDDFPLFDIQIAPVAVGLCDTDLDRLRQSPPDLPLYGEYGELTMVAAIDVATGRVLDTVDPPGLAIDCWYATATAGTTTYIARWGEGECAQPTVLTVGPSGRIETIAEIAPPLGATPGVGCIACDVSRLVARGETVVLDLWWSDPVSMHEVVAVGRDGEVRWRTGAGVQQPIEVVAATEQGVITWWDGSWRLLALADGTEVARQPIEGHESWCYNTAATDGQRLYYACGRSVAVYDANRLTLLGTWDDVLADDDFIGPFDRLRLGDGLLIATIDNSETGEDERLVALTDPPRVDQIT